MRYLVRARVKPGGEGALLQAVERGTLGKGSVAGGEYLRNMQDARLCEDGTARWVEVCYCPTPLQEERPYWEQHFDLVKVQDAHDRQAMPGPERIGAMGLRDLRLHGTFGTEAGDLGRLLLEEAQRWVTSGDGRPKIHLLDGGLRGAKDEPVVIGLRRRTGALA